jgi:hypothetical protein
MRTPIIAGNWKMHKTVKEALNLVKEIHYGLTNPGEVEVVVSPPTTALYKVAEFLQDSYSCAKFILGRCWSLYRRSFSPFAQRSWSEICNHRPF